MKYWLDPDARNAVELFPPVEIPLFDEAGGAADLLAAGVVDLEVQRSGTGFQPLLGL